MRGFIEGKMNQIFIDFKRDLRELGRLCVLKDFRFDGEHLPYYANPTMQRYYLLKYLPAYLVEYFEIYSQMLNLDFLRNGINVLSLGSGCGIDYWGLAFAIKRRLVHMPYSYVGIDSIEWEYNDFLDNNNCNFVHENIFNVMNLGNNRYNVLMFPKSIGEFEQDTFQRLEQALCNTNFDSNEIVILASIRNARLNEDVEEIKKVIAIFTNYKGYRLIDNEDKYWYYPEKSGLKTICQDFYYPEEIKNFLTSLNETCIGYQQNGLRPCEYTCSYMNRNPILTTSQIKYQLLRLKR